MASITATRSADTDFKMEGLRTILTIFCSCSLVLLATENVKSLPIPGSVVATIAVLTMVITCAQFLRHMRKNKADVFSDKKDVNDPYDVIDVFSAESDRRRSSVIMSAVSERLNNRSVSLPDIEKLHRCIDDCASFYNVSGSHLLFLAFVQRIEYLFAGVALHASPWIVRLGCVRLEFLPAGTSPYTHFRDMWLEDLDLMPTARMRSRFVLMRFVDAFGIVCDYGLLGHVRTKILALIQMLRLGKADRF